MKWRAKPWPEAGEPGGLAIGLAVLLTGCSPAPDSSAPPAITLTAPRDYGYVLGDVIEHTLSLDLPDGSELDPASLPAPGPVNDWLSIRASRLETLATDGGARQQVHISYQIFQGVRQPETVSIPPVTLQLSGQPPRELHSPAWPFTLTPVIPPDIKDEEIELRDPLPPVPAPTAAAWRVLGYWLAGLAGVTGLFALRQYLRRRRQRPFAAAARQLAAALAGRLDENALGDGLRILHRAFDHTFGETLFVGQIERFCAEHPAFAPLQDRLAAFFALSQSHFFAPGSAGVTDPATRAWLLDLGRRCATAERRAL